MADISDGLFDNFVGRVYSNTGPVYLQYCQKLAFRMQEIDADRDIHEFVLANEKLMFSKYPKFEDSEV